MSLWTLLLTTTSIAATLAAVKDMETSSAEVDGTQASTVEISLDAPGPIFDGLGGLSAGAGTRLLIDYPEPQRSWVLDYLFKPSFGASLQVLKIEIGGTGDSTIGTEDSHERTRGHIDMDRGYELWFAQEALKRNHKLVLYGLPWTFPPWVEVATEGFGPAAITYLADWVVGVENALGRPLQYLGWHNESPWENSWVLGLRQELDRRGKGHVKLVVADCGPNFQTSYAQLDGFFHNQTLSSTAAAIGLHYPNSIMPARLPSSQSYYRNLSSLPDGQKLWSSEEFSTPATQSGSRCLAKLFNRNFIDGNLTSSIVWSIIYAWYTDLACSGQGLICVVDSVWSAAHTTQFSEVGWRYATQGSGSGYLPANQAAAHHAVEMMPCNVSMRAQRWLWRVDGSIANLDGRCLSTRGGGRVYTESCDGSNEQRFRNHSRMQHHIESVAHPGLCLDHNMGSGDLDTYSCCTAPTCAEKNEEWLSRQVSGVGDILVSATNGECVTEGSAELSGGSGSYVTLYSPDGHDFSVVIETMNNDASTCDYGNAGWDDIIVGSSPAPVRFCFKGSTCPRGKLRSLFYSNFNASVQFEQQPVPPIDSSCCVMLTLQPNSLYTLSTITTAKKGSHSIDPVLPTEGQAPSCASVANWTNRTPFPLPYSTVFQPAQVRFMNFAEYFSDMQGIFRVEPNPYVDVDGSAAGSVLSQKVFALAHATTWGDPFGDPPTTLLGSDEWRDYSVTASVRLPHNASDSDFAGVGLRFGHGYEFSGIGGYKLGLAADNSWFLNSSCSARTVCNATTLAHGQLAYSSTGVDHAHELASGLRTGWQYLTLQAAGSTLTAKINGQVVATVSNSKWGNGYAGVFCGWHAAYIKSFSVAASATNA